MRPSAVGPQRASRGTRKSGGTVWRGGGAHRSRPRGTRREAPRGEAGEPHSPVPLPSGGDFAELNELFEPLSPRLEPRSDRFGPHPPLSAPLSLPPKRREASTGPRSPLLASREGPGEVHSPLGESPAGEGMELEELFRPCTSREVRPDSWGMSHSPSPGSHPLQGKPAGLRGMRQKKRFRRLEIPVKPD
jgi:hypothetical protein